MREHLIFVAALSVASALASCQKEAEEGPEGAAGETEQAGEGAAEKTEPSAGEHTWGVVELASQEPYGAYLVGPTGHPYYMFTADRQGQPSTCYDACAEAWPPVLTRGEPQSSDPDVDSEKLGTVERRGSDQRQVTYGGWPLYTYAHDQDKRVTGQDVHHHGGEWYLVGPDGNKIEATEGEDAEE